MEANTSYYLELLSAVIGGKNIPIPGKGIDLHEVYKISTNHSQFSIYHDGINALEKKYQPPESVIEKMNQLYSRHLYRDVIKAEQMDNIINLFEKAGVKCMGLKGYVIRTLYPKSVYRYLSDFDILVDSCNFKLSVSLLEQEGYQILKDDPHHTVLTKGPTAVEVHKKLFVGEFEEYFSNPFERAQLCAGYNCVYKMSPEDFYIYFITHTASHFTHSGIGLRSLTDAYLIAKHYPKLDFDYINSQLNTLKLKTFSQEFFKLSQCLFENCEFTIFQKELLDYICSSNTSGTVSRESELKLAKAGSKKNNFLKNAFPSQDYLSYKYPWVKKSKFLIPFAWIKRAVDITLNSSRRDRVESSLLVNENRAKEVKKLAAQLELL